MKRHFVLALSALTISSCASQIDEKADAETRGILIQLKEPLIFENETSKQLMCTTIRGVISSLTMERKRISNKTLAELNYFADKCSIDRYEMK